MVFDIIFSWWVNVIWTWRYCSVTICIQRLRNFGFVRSRTRNWNVFGYRFLFFHLLTSLCRRLSSIFSKEVCKLDSQGRKGWPHFWFTFPAGNNFGVATEAIELKIFPRPICIHYEISNIIIDYISWVLYFGRPILMPVDNLVKNSLFHSSLGKGMSPNVNISNRVAP